MRPVLWLTIIHGIVALAWAQPRPPGPYEAEFFAGARREAYRTVDGSEWTLYIFGADATPAAPKPAIVFFHGSGWVRGWVSQFAPYARALAERGMIAVCADYRTQSNSGTKPMDAMADARAALMLLKAESKRLGIDPARIAAGGASSGAQLALTAALPVGDETSGALPAALVLMSAITDTTDEGYPEGVALFEGHEKDYSPLLRLRAGMPPALLLHGESDAWVPVASARKFAEGSRALGNDVELVTFAGRGHAFFNTVQFRPGVRREDFFTVLFLIEQFFARLGWLPAAEHIGSERADFPTP